jgi:hypothetical protein
VRAVAPGTTQKRKKGRDLPKSKESLNQTLAPAGVNQPLSATGTVAEMTRVTTRLRGLAESIRAFVGTFSGVVRDAFNQVLAPLDEVVGLFDAANFAIKTLTSIPAELEQRLAKSLNGMLTQVQNLVADASLLGVANDLYIETRLLSEALFARANGLFGSVSDTSPAAILRAENVKYTDQRALYGGPGPQLNDPGGSVSLASTPFIAGTGFSTLSDTDFSLYDTVKSDIVFDGESIYDFARRATGDVQTAPLIIALNRLQFPYFVARDAVTTVGTIAAGQPVLVPASSSAQLTATDLPLALATAPSYQGSATAIDPSGMIVSDGASSWRDHQWAGFTLTIGASGATQTAIILDNVAHQLMLDHPLSALPLLPAPYRIKLVQQQKQQPTTVIERRYGIDLQLVFAPTQSQQAPLADIVVAPHGDLALIGGMANLQQALTILCLTEEGRNVANPDYGLALPIGEANTQERAIALNLAARRALLADPRIASVARTELAANGDITNLVATVVPVGSAQQVLTLPTTL